MLWHCRRVGQPNFVARERSRVSFRLTEMLLQTGKPPNGRGYSDEAVMGLGFQSQSNVGDVVKFMRCRGIWGWGTSPGKWAGEYPPAVVE